MSEAMETDATGGACCSTTGLKRGLQHVTYHVGLVAEHQWPQRSPVDHHAVRVALLAVGRGHEDALSEGGHKLRLYQWVSLMPQNVGIHHHHARKFT